MEKVDVVLSVPKEGKEVVDLLDAVLEKVLAKAEMQTYLELVDEFVKAAEGVQNIKEEIASDGKDELAAYLVHKVLSRLVS